MLQHVDVQQLDSQPSASFDCGRDVQNAYFHDCAWSDQTELLTTTYLLHAHGLTAGFLSLCMDSIPLSRREREPSIRFRAVSALKLAQLGIDRRFQGSGLGRWAVGFAVDLARELSTHVGCRYVTLDAQPELETWYSAQGFHRNKLHHEQRLEDARLHGRDPAAVAVSMRFDLREAA
jgi:GNAT superfamily N-acetyltransferase